MREIAQRLIGFDTTSDRNNAPAMDYAAELLERAGFSIHLNRYHRDGVEKTNLLAQVGPPEPPGLMISGHMDTVPFDNQSGWTRDPLNLEVDDEWVYGRGTSDMKVFLAQTLDAVQ
ncbi:MAG: M20/M25/M40 family metallo-hydrolase, partial [Nitrospinaceae bacterium]|nr:M20/M25/M40 family metallo-hydrolase [Nitrospinaceae bacterium]NIR57771.1 M20/M25/M40 family metallo-hydrolase [Nitrospinaceae bacterium]NIT85113.1 M20/M25/M40 family metallo-hydrolase [Nitrospinaceae bacterium]NIW08834.1 M20/M25/M40 family metallo-hydrolase [Nitrospinaceae bacterium]NIX37428.1 M20/M25/M40 family metallo-hydrolase [Nitrospinaceae bacterium]